MAVFALAMCAAVAVMLGPVEGLERRHVRLGHGPLDFEMDLPPSVPAAGAAVEGSEGEVSATQHKNEARSSLEELFEEQGNVQISAELSASGPLTRADFNGEKPYEVEDIAEDVDAAAAAVAPPAASAAAVEVPVQTNVQYDELPSLPATVAAVDVGTVPTMLSDGRLVRLPAEEAGAAAATSGDDAQLAGNGKDEASNKKADNLVAPDLPVQATEQQPQAEAPAADTTQASLPETTADTSAEAPAAAAAVPSHEESDIQLLQTEAGLGAGLKGLSKGGALQTDEDGGPSLPFAAKKVRVSQLVSGIISSTLSSVLTRGMEFTSAR